MKRRMKASDAMVRKVITTHPQASISEVAKPLVDNEIRALPVVDDAGRVIGVISEADLMRRKEVGSKVPGPPILIGRLEVFQRLGGAFAPRHACP